MTFGAVESGFDACGVFVWAGKSATGSELVGYTLSCAARSCAKFSGTAFETDCERGSESFMRAMILAAGYGTRLWPLTIDRAKPAIPFMGRPLIGYVAEYLARHGFDDIVVNLHHRPESVRAALGDGSDFGVRFHYVEEPVILGTSGAVENARHLLEGDAFVVVNGKIATDIDLGAALETHRRTRA